jgi:outer membrane protein assembly factor BamB
VGFQSCILALVNPVLIITTRVLQAKRHQGMLDVRCPEGEAKMQFSSTPVFGVRVLHSLLLILTVARALPADTVLVAVNPPFPPATAGNVQSLDAITGAYLGVAALGIALTAETTLAIGPDGNLYVGDFNSSQIFKFSPTGTLLGVFVSAGSGGLNGPSGMTFGPDGNLYVNSYFTNQVLKYNGSTGAFIATFVSAGSGGLTSPTGLVFRVAGTIGEQCIGIGECLLLVGSGGTNQVLAYDYSTGAFTTTFVSAGSGGLSSPADLAFGPDGNFYVVSQSSGQVLRYNGTTGAFISAFVPAGSGGLSLPQGMVFGDGNLYVGSERTNQVLEYNATTGAFAGVFAAGLGGTPVRLLFVPSLAMNVDIGGSDNCGYSFAGFPAGSWWILIPPFSVSSEVLLTKQLDACSPGLFSFVVQGEHAASTTLTETDDGAVATQWTLKTVFGTVYGITAASTGAPVESLGLAFDEIEEHFIPGTSPPPLWGTSPVPGGESTTTVTIAGLNCPSSSFTTLTWSFGVTVSGGTRSISPRLSASRWTLVVPLCQVPVQLEKASMRLS